MIFDKCILEPDRDFGTPFIEKSRELDAKIICAHVGLPLPWLERGYADPSDVPIVARRYPDVTLIGYHASFDPAAAEGAFGPDLPLDQIPIGIDRSVLQAE